MLENLFCAFVAVFFTVGFVCSALYLLLFLTRSKNGTSFVVSFIPWADENAAARISRLLSGLQLTAAGARARVIAVCEDEDHFTRSRLRQAFPCERRLTVCTRSELPGKLRDLAER